MNELIDKSNDWKYLSDDESRKNSKYEEMKLVYTNRYHLITSFHDFQLRIRKRELNIQKQKNTFNKLKVSPIKLIEDYTKKLKKEERQEKEYLLRKSRSYKDINKEKLKPTTQEYNKDDIYFQMEKVGEKMFENLHVIYQYLLLINK